MLQISDKLIGMVTELFPTDPPNVSIEKLIENELIRRLSRYRYTNENLKKKYQMDFATFKARNILATKEYSFEVESDYCDWEMALDGINSMERKLSELRG